MDRLCAAPNTKEQALVQELDGLHGSVMEEVHVVALMLWDNNFVVIPSLNKSS